MITYTIFSDGEVNFPLGSMDEKGNLLSGVDALGIIFAEIKRGSESDKANNLLCVLDTEHPEVKDVITLGELMGRPSRPIDEIRADNLLSRIPRNELGEHTGYTHKAIDEIVEVEAPDIEKKKDLSKRVIKSGNRYKSKVDWSSDRVKNQVQGLLDHGRSLSYIARHLKVSRSTLSEANKRHNYRLYPPDKRLNPHLYAPDIGRAK